MLRPADVTWSNVPVIDTFGAGGPAGAWARTGGASIARATRASTAVTRLLLITVSSSGGEKHRIPRQHSTPTSPTTPERSRIQSDPARGQRIACAVPRGPRPESRTESVGNGKEHDDLQARADNNASLAMAA